MVRISNQDLIRLLRKNARTTYLNLAKALGVSEAAIRKRIKKLEEEGIIKRYTIEVDPRKMGYNVQALIGVDTKPETYLQTIDRLKSMKEVMSLYSSSGDHMIIMECWFKDAKKLTEFVKKLNSMEGVARVCPAIILEKIK